MQHQRRLRVEGLRARRHERPDRAAARRGRGRRACGEEALRQRRAGLPPEREQAVAERLADDMGS